MQPTRIGLILNLRSMPTIDEANKIQRVFGEEGIYVDVIACWPERFNGLKRSLTIEQTADVDFDRLIEQPKVFELEDQDLLGVVEKSTVLTDTQKKILIDHYWKGRSQPEIAAELGVSSAAISHQKITALSKLRRVIDIHELDAFAA